MLVALLYRLVVLHFASQILPTIGADSWERETGVDYGWDERPVSLEHVYAHHTDTRIYCLFKTSKLTYLVLTYRQSIFVTVYSNLLREWDT